eukprot:3818416-Pyramimonas_sp.AAC.1
MDQSQPLKRNIPHTPTNHSPSIGNAPHFTSAASNSGNPTTFGHTSKGSARPLSPYVVQGVPRIASGGAIPAFHI